MHSLYLFAVSILFAAARAQQSAYGQCGGINWTGPTTCVAGYHCLVQNPYYYQCVQGVAATTLATSTKPKCTGKKATRSVAAEQSAYGQCGGINWSGVTTCVTGYYCLVQNPYYFQCVPGAPTSTSKSSTKTKCTGKKTTTTTPSVSVRDVQCTPITVLRSTTTQAPNIQRALTTTASQCSWKTVAKNTAKTSSTTTSAAAASSQSSSSFKWFGVNVAGAEFGTAKPGVYNTDYTFASTASLDTLMAEGYNIFRFPFMMERMAPTTMSSPLAAYYLGNYSLAINHVTQKGGYAILDPHNFGRYYDAIITDTAAFKTFWSNLAAAFKDNSRVIFDTNNEYHDMDISLVFNLNQAAIDGIRGAGATSQYIFAEGNSYSAAWFWATASDMLKDLKDPQNKLVYEMHLYLDSDNSGTSSTCASSTVGVDRITAATAWLKANNKVGILGEFAGGNNDLCMTAVKGLVNHLKDNKDVWTGALWWAAGPWWGDYLYGFEPPSGVGYTYYDQTLKAFAPGISA